MKATLTLAALGLALTTAFAQEAPNTATPVSTQAAPAQTVPSASAPAPGTMKIGYTNVQYLLAASPQTKVIKSQLESASKQYEKAISDKMKELEEKFASYQKNEASMMESIKKANQDELRNLETSIRGLQERAQGELKDKENELVKPELDKIYTAINDVAKANAYNFVLNAEQVILYAAEGSDMTNLVLKKLGYPDPKDEPMSTTASPKAATQKPATSAPAPAKPGGAPSPSGKKKK